jgi:anti-sigma regulatory factor (Ser/Thr protein kinase)/ActR/RegA family two-component response regulator
MDLSENSEAAGQTPSAAPPAILLIGHDPQAEVGLPRELAALGCSFAHAAGGADALRRLRETPFKVVITSPETAFSEDLALVEEIRRVRPGVRVIILAASGTPEELLTALRRHTFLCQCAPFNVREIAHFAAEATRADDSTLGIDVISAQRNWISVRMNCNMLNADRLMAFFSQLRQTIPEHPPEEMMTAFQEILNNAIEHGAHNDPSKLVEVAAVRTGRAFVFYVADPGEGFRRDNLPHSALYNTPAEPTRHLEIREKSGMRPGGYGILLATGIVDELIYNETGNSVLLIKYLDDLALAEDEAHATRQIRTEWMTQTHSA